MKILGSFCLLLLLFQTAETERLREAYSTASNSVEEAEVFIKLTESTDVSAVQQAYRGAAFALKSKFGKQKIKHLKEAKSLIENAVLSEPENIEIRMIRLSIQENLPRIARYDDAILADKEFIATHLKNLRNKSLKKYLQGFIAASKSFSPEEKKLLLQ